MPGFDGTDIDGVSYCIQPTPNVALYLASYSQNPVGIFPSQMRYRQPYLRGREVVVYVMEKNYGDADVCVLQVREPASSLRAKFEEPYDRNRLQLLDKDGSSGLQPVYNQTGHGAAVVSLIGGATYGAAQQCTVVVVSRQEVEGNDDVFGWVAALRAVLKDFTTNRKGKAGVMNISAGFRNTKGRSHALEKVMSAGIIVVGAAGNDSVSYEPILCIADP